MSGESIRMKIIIGKIIIDILTSIYQPFWFAILLSMTMFFYLYVKCPEGAGKGWKAAVYTWVSHFKKDREFRKKYILFFYITMVLFKTLINRNMWMNPLSDVWGVWGIYTYNSVTGQRVLTSECIENFLLFMPYIILIFWNFEEKIFGKKVYIGKIVLESIKIAFLSSLTIELLQLLLRLGTIQISDLFFNTVGGLVGGIIYFLVNAGIERIRRADI